MQILNAKTIKLLAGTAIATAAVAGAAAPGMAATAAPASAPGIVQADLGFGGGQIDENEYQQINNEVQKAVKGKNDPAAALGAANEAAFNASKSRVNDASRLSTVAYNQDARLDFSAGGVQPATSFDFTVGETAYSVAVFTDPVNVTKGKQTQGMDFATWQVKSAKPIKAIGWNTVILGQD